MNPPVGQYVDMTVTQRDDAARSERTGETGRGASRRAFLRAGGVAGVGLAAGSASGATERALTATQSDDQRWGSYQFDAANTGYAPENTGPVTNVGEKWRDSGEYDFTNGAPVVADGTVYKIRTDGIAAYDAADGTEQWHVEYRGGVSGSPTVADGTVYAPSAEGGVYALDAGDGTEQWFFATVDDGREQVSSVWVSSRVGVGALRDLGGTRAGDQSSYRPSARPECPDRIPRPAVSTASVEARSRTRHSASRDARRPAGRPGGSCPLRSLSGWCPLARTLGDCPVSAVSAPRTATNATLVERRPARH